MLPLHLQGVEGGEEMDTLEMIPKGMISTQNKL